MFSLLIYWYKVKVNKIRESSIHSHPQAAKWVSYQCKRKGN